MEYVDNSLDDAERLYHRGKKTYKRQIKISIVIGHEPASVVVTDNCTGMDRKQLTRLIQNVGESMKHSRFTNGQFGFGVHAFRAACKHMRVVSRARGKVQSLVLDINRQSMDFTAPRVMQSLTDERKLGSGTQIFLSDFDKAWCEGLNVDDIVKEIQYHFGDMLDRQNLKVTVANQEGKSVVCKPFDFTQIQGKKIKKTYKIENYKILAKLWVSATPIENQGCYFTAHGRRIHEVHEIKSFMKSSQARWSCWSHPNLVGSLEVGDIVEPVITRDEFRRTHNRHALYRVIVNELEPLVVKMITAVNKQRRVLEMGRLGNILSKCFNMTVKKEQARTKGADDYLAQMAGNRASKTGKRKLPEEWTKPDEEPAPEEEIPPADNVDNPQPEDDVQEPDAKRPKQEREKKIEKLRKVGGKFEMIFVNDLKDTKGRMQRGLLVGENMYINVSHPDFSERVYTNRAGSKLQITERLCSYIANVCANSYKSAIISRKENGLSEYAENQAKLFQEILDLEFSMESSLRKYLPAIQKEVQK